jgi:hypothetical protein
MKVSSKCNAICYAAAGPEAGIAPISRGKAGRRIRTDDLLITNQLLYQLSYAGENAREISARAPPGQALVTTSLCHCELPVRKFVPLPKPNANHRAATDFEETCCE